MTDRTSLPSLAPKRARLEELYGLVRDGLGQTFPSIDDTSRDCLLGYLDELYAALPSPTPSLAAKMELVDLAGQIEAQFPAQMPSISYSCEFIFSVKMDYRDWHIVLKALRSTAPSPTANIVQVLPLAPQPPTITTTSEGETPRTDAEEIMLEDERGIVNSFVLSKLPRQLERELAEASADATHYESEVARLQKTTPSATTSKDTERLDWLEKNLGTFNYFVPGVRNNGVVKKAVELEWKLPDGNYTFEDADTIREAIDAAMDGGAQT